MLRKDEAVKRWFPLSVIACGISFVVTFILNLPVEKVIASTVIAGVIVFSGFFFRSFGKDEEEYK
ncbi:MAG TPA: hypothetical protein VFK40_12070 [Nitrososphaeraceae archaeon]|jgi:hypothetical protein|nr:hypothetical protein [Nitrososphaeraceae archaeon]